VQHNEKKSAYLNTHQTNYYTTPIKCVTGTP
jgi:hypothetical protein